MKRASIPFLLPAGTRVLGVNLGALAVALTRYTFTLIGVQPPTLNVLMRGRIRDRIRLGKAWRNEVQCACYARFPRAKTKRRVTLTIILGPRQRGADPDAYFKAVGDALVKCGQLVDDNRHGVEWAPVKYEKGTIKGCTIEMEDML